MSIDNPHHPYHWPVWQKYGIVVVYCMLQVFVTLTSTTYVGVEWIVEEKFNVGAQVATLGQSMFILGTAVGPAFLGPLSDVSGRKWVYVGSMIFYLLINIGCALPRNMAMLAIFMFMAGAAGSTALSNVAGTIGDLFVNSDSASQPMAIFVMSANVGPSIGSPIGEWIGDNEHMGLPWIFWINVIFAGFFAIILCFLPETLPRVVISRELKKEGEDPEAVVKVEANVFQEISFVFIMALKILVTEPVVLFLGLYNGFAYGLLFLYLDGVFSVFVYNNGLSYVGADLTYLNFVVGVVIMFCFVPVQTYFYKRAKAKNGGVGQPEYRFITSLVTVWGFPISLFWFAFTSDGSVNYWSCIVAGALLGFSDPLLWLAMLNYITDSYPDVTGSAIAAFTIPSFAIAAALAHAGVAMFDNMSTTWGFATLAFISLGIVALIYLLYFMGPKIRSKSKLARKF
ncbi:hypothetical protein PACTADRAFT_37810 [Pachysolen tannophilus NRRL Y-2460]|uniref:Major facilitator superfamily (MFS) profile domain-containing protein n=1 Tax=Pachysolen tannophilus NRRL Y-2460 TaxID=669874 RepID=A0A1E4U148_PACTA|nr:hypothetical protein PACTADRAFT_37810 [Pachysolen tannophilus NRRL Y-2460]